MLARHSIIFPLRLHHRIYCICAVVLFRPCLLYVWEASKYLLLLRNRFRVEGHPSPSCEWRNRRISYYTTALSIEQRDILRCRTSHIRRKVLCWTTGRKDGITYSRSTC